MTGLCMDREALDGIMAGLRAGGECSEAQELFFCLVDAGELDAEAVFRGQGALAEAAGRGCGYSAYLLAIMHALPHDGASNLQWAHYWFAVAARAGDWRGYQGAAETAARLALRHSGDIEAAETALGWLHLATDVCEMPGCFMCLEEFREQLLELHPELAAWEDRARARVEATLPGWQ